MENGKIEALPRPELATAAARDNPGDRDGSKATG
jgi:hypothetical protein